VNLGDGFVDLWGIVWFYCFFSALFIWLGDVFGVIFCFVFLFWLCGWRVFLDLFEASVKGGRIFWVVVLGGFGF